MGCTREQIEMDTALQAGTVVHILRNGRYSCSYNTDQLCLGCNTETGITKKRLVFRMLKVASRGKFASDSPTTNTTWLQPTENWFSLSKYLACRFEFSLWKAFWGTKPINTHGEVFSAFNHMTEDTVWLVIYRVVGAALKENVLVEVKTSRIIDSFLWRLLEICPRNGICRSTSRPCARRCLKNLHELTLEDMADAHMVELKRSISRNVHELLTSLVAESLLAELEQDSMSKVDFNQNGHKKKCRKKNCHRKSKSVGGVSSSKMTKSLSVLMENDHDDADSLQQELSFPDNKTSSRERHRNTIFVLSIVEEIVENACRKVGLPDNSTSSPRCEHSTAPLLKKFDLLVDDTMVPVTGVALSQHSVLLPTNQPMVATEQQFLATTPTSGILGASPIRKLSHENPAAVVNASGMVWDVSDAALDDWGRVQGFASREQSIFTELFPSLDQVASNSRIRVPTLDFVGFEPQLTQAEKQSFEPLTKARLDGLSLKVGEESGKGSRVDKSGKAVDIIVPSKPHLSRSLSSSTGAETPAVVTATNMRPLHATRSRDDVRTLAVATASMGETVAVKVSRSVSYRSGITRPIKSRDDHDIQRQRRPADALSSYRFVMVKDAVMKARDDHDIRETIPLVHKAGVPSGGVPTYRYRLSSRSLMPGMCTTTAGSTTSPRPPSHVNFDNSREARDLCARSETLEAGVDMDHWLDRPDTSIDDGDNNTTTKDETTTITSAPTHHESDETTRLREERNAYRDMCLTLEAEVAKLTNLLATQRVSSTPAASVSGGPFQPNLAEPVFDPESVAHGFISTRARTLAAMSDAGFRAEHESMASEESVALRRHGFGMTESDWSIDQTSAALQSTQFHFPSSVNQTREYNEPLRRNGMQSRLALDIWQFVDATHAQLRKQSQLRQNAVERMMRLVNTLWPRAQVKLYGSHVTGVCLPSSDVDFIICLPAVHKNDVAVAPGVLEGRNAINESSQKILYRKLKAEPWIDPRSIKLIERTLVPVIKVSTKEAKGRALQLDITFDAPGHHGLEAVELVTQIIKELPTIQALVLVLKQFLLTKSLLTAYTGGLSSYCLFLMVARFLQEQPSVFVDVGALLISFLDFFGNFFDPRTTGLSIRRREYFARPSYSSSRLQPRTIPSVPTPTPPSWQTPTYISHPAANTQFYRRNSFSDKGNAEAVGHGPLMMARPHQLHHGLSRQSPSPHMYLQDGALTNNTGSNFEHRVSYNFDPLWVEDPLNESNNVGRNAFRYLQVQRAFSDAHRALVAALEWEMPSATDLENDSEYPLLKCLLQSEDMVFNL
ncbi:hypothetical protein MPSEU_000442100 [Mayamaea pseudoterrestris]|nr:hypothetical protein MPSEU_000442100 [Mayamaea pseudoterrestris]